MVAKADNKIGLISTIFLGVSSIIGSGWLFAPYKSAMIAGPASLFSWIIGAFIICVLSLIFAEIASVFPKRGLSAIVPTISHNKFFGFPFALSNWLGMVAVIGLEAQATIQYIINLMPSLMDLIFLHGQMTFVGNIFTVLLILMLNLSH